MKDVIFGIHTILNILKTNPLLVKKIFILNSKKISNKIKELFFYIKKYNVLLYKVDKKWLDKKTNNSIHQGIMGIIDIIKPFNEKDINHLIKKFKKPLILILDHITDPHNLGACIRSAVAAKVNMIILPKNRSAKINATVKKISCGTSENIPIIFVKNLIKVINLLKIYKIYVIGGDNKKKNIIFNYKLDYPICLIMGSEDKGISPIIKKNCDELFAIPMFNNVNSLNISVATGIFLFEIMRQNYFIHKKLK
ncbi:23S rRNA (guanosine(2251)-2'-O)-methyltransferase RlmB [Enterobacteriaceae endosymbiont of Donacia tomentosa]|uniref:23S rRNA (guanosine(2251)-2'-O)-methyltransferase RlmB n=1 Tax=Enterobacteriaceae endosymbiont of Donacia tomentosa TaxID=2675787 RepID=UPI00145687CC|nr:23S rRNA (guanosine(2251)-2'-O)-methyltransferase RlmB [Enterobacteriaceae endosymbiont of Donacia tomentosa]